MEIGSEVRALIRFIIHVVVAVVMAWFLAFGLCFSVVHTGQSMEPTLMPEDTVMINRFVYHFHAPDRFDVIAYTVDEPVSGDDDILRDQKTEIRRIVGLPGENIRIEDGHIFIDGRQTEDFPGLGPVTLAGVAADGLTLGNNEYFVLGDNRQASEDSRFDNIGNIGKERIIGKVWLRTKPFSELGRIE